MQFWHQLQYIFLLLYRRFLLWPVLPNLRACGAWRRDIYPSPRRLQKEMLAKMGMEGWIEASSLMRNRKGHPGRETAIGTRPRGWENAIPSGKNKFIKMGHLGHPRGSQMKRVYTTPAANWQRERETLGLWITTKAMIVYFLSTAVAPRTEYGTW